jgi:hypothetical protein
MIKVDAIAALLIGASLFLLGFLLGIAAHCGAAV